MRTTFRFRLSRAVAATGLGLALAAAPAALPAGAHSVPAAPAASTPASLGGIPAQVWAEQTRLDAAADAIDPILRPDPAFTGVWVDARGHRLLGYGTAPFDAARWARASALMPAGETLGYARSQLTDSQVKVLDAYVSMRQKQGLRVERWGLDSLAGTFGVTLEHGVSLPASDTKYLRRFGAASLAVRAGDARSSGRYDNTSPFQGGSEISGPWKAGTNSYYAKCTSGFTSRSTTNGFYYIITAAHCIKWSDPREWTGTEVPNVYLGQATAHDLNHDAAYIKIASNTSVVPDIYSGVWGNNTDGHQIVGAAANHGGDYACQAGVVSGLTCFWITVSDYYMAKNGYDGSTYQTAIWIGNDGNTSHSMIANGDSGGPVFSFTGQNLAALARGINSGGDWPVSCPHPGMTGCEYQIFFGDVNWMSSYRSLDLTP